MRSARLLVADPLRVSITGGGGFIGSHLVELLVDRGHDVTVIDDFSSGSSTNLSTVADRIRIIEGDIVNLEVAAQAAAADVVFHLAVRNVRASIGAPGENFRVNATGTLRVLEAMRAGDAGRFVYVSSSEVYGEPVEMGFSETTVPAPTTVYGAGKLAGEHVTLAYHRTYGLDTRVVRPFNNYGPRSHFEGDSGEVIPKFILRALGGVPLHIHGDGEQTRDFMFVRDTAYWLAELADTPALSGEVVNIGTGIEQSVSDLAATVIAATGSQSSIEYGPRRPGDLPRLRADVAKVGKYVDFHLPTSFEAGLEETIGFFITQDVEALLVEESERNW